MAIVIGHSYDKEINPLLCWKTPYSYKNKKEESCYIFCFILRKKVRSTKSDDTLPIRAICRSNRFRLDGCSSCHVHYSEVRYKGSYHTIQSYHYRKKVITKLFT